MHKDKVALLRFWMEPFATNRMITIIFQHQFLYILNFRASVWQKKIAHNNPCLHFLHSLNSHSNLPVCVQHSTNTENILTAHKLLYTILLEEKGGPSMPVASTTFSSLIYYPTHNKVNAIHMHLLLIQITRYSSMLQSYRIELRNPGSGPRNNETQIRRNYGKLYNEYRIYVNHGKKNKRWRRMEYSLSSEHTESMELHSILSYLLSNKISLIFTYKNMEL